MGTTCSCSGKTPIKKTATLKESVHSMYGKDHEVAKKSEGWMRHLVTEIETGLTTHKRPGWSTALWLGMVDVRTLAELAPQQIGLMRELTDAASVFGQALLPSDVHLEHVHAPGLAGTDKVRCLWAWPHDYKSPAEAPAHLLFVHGGAFCLGSPETHMQLICQIAQRANCAVLAPAYRRCPENSLDAAVADVISAYRYMLAHLKKLGAPSGDSVMSNVVFGGESAGASLSVLAALRLRDKREAPQARALALMSPWVDIRDSVEQIKPSWAENEPNDFVLGKLARKFAIWVVGAQQKGGVPHPDSKAGRAVFEALENDQETLVALASKHQTSPAHTPQLGGLPKCLVLTGGCETLRDSQLEFAERLQQAGILAESKVYDDMPHAVGLANFMASEDAQGSGPMDIVVHFSRFVAEVCGTPENADFRRSFERPFCACMGP